LGGLWALKLVWHIYETILRWAGISRICIPSPIIAAFIVSETTAFIRTDEQSDMARSTRLVILIMNLYILYGSERLLLRVKYFPNLIYPFTLRVAGIIISKIN